MHQLHCLIQRLADAGLDFVLIGGYAGVLHGSTLVTDDLDVCAVLSPENIEKIRRAFADNPPGASHHSPEIVVLGLSGAGPRL